MKSSISRSKVKEQDDIKRATEIFLSKGKKIAVTTGGISGCARTIKTNKGKSLSVQEAKKAFTQSGTVHEEWAYRGISNGR
jgi:hypothetical protein